MSWRAAPLFLVPACAFAALKMAAKALLKKAILRAGLDAEMTLHHRHGWCAVLAAFAHWAKPR